MADSELSNAEIIAMAEDALRQICAFEGIDFDAEKAKRQTRPRPKNHKKS